MMWPFAPYLAWKARRKAKKDEQAAERRRQALIAQREDRKARHQPSRHLNGLINQATEASLRAYVAGRA